MEDNLAEELLIFLSHSTIMEYSLTLNLVNTVILDESHIVNCLYCYEHRWRAYMDLFSLAENEKNRLARRNVTRCCKDTHLRSGYGFSYIPVSNKSLRHA